MSTRLTLFLLAGILFFIIIIFIFLKRKKLNLKYVLLWLFSAVIMIIATLVPSLTENLAEFVGIVTPINFVFVLQGFFVLVILLSITVIASHTTNKIFRLVQTQALLEKRVRELEKEAQSKTP